MQGIPLIPSAETADPLSNPHLDSPLSPSPNLSELFPTPFPRENEQLPPTVINLTTNYVEENTEDATSARSLSIYSSMTTSTSFSTIPTSRFGKVSDVGSPECPEPTADEPRMWNPNRERTPTMGSTGIFPSHKRISASSSTGSDLSSMWSVNANDFSHGPLGGGRPRSSTLPVS